MTEPSLSSPPPAPALPPDVTFACFLLPHCLQAALKAYHSPQPLESAPSSPGLGRGVALITSHQGPLLLTTASML